MKNDDNIIKTKSRDFAIKTVLTYKWITEKKHEFVMSKQLLRCGTSIGANIAEAVRGQTKPDFFAKMNIALKEASETNYWLDILHATAYLPDDLFNKLNVHCNELIRILVSITKKQQTN